ncbi:hypothetical protein LK464_15030 [Mycobacteroides abscessus subsp. abscessus]|uniref:hypothetical protein n=1 Tax=Mycobacteroides abscessus TaxID=36809 RepID=UPI001896440C|nr:hypothetical protein [Mycobacteroides abscessus]UEA22796.1 hypothetical protein LK464_15030 [Mycobacteroides abscessus subsp. abscessus]
MTTAIRYESESSIVSADGHAELRLHTAAPNAKYVKVIEPEGTIRLVPLALLHESERALLEDPELYRQTRQALAEYAAGERVSSDFLFADDE